MDNTVYKIFKELQIKEQIHSDSFMVAPLPFSDYHKIGISNDKEPMFFIQCKELGGPVDIDLEFFSVLFNRSCRIYEDGIVENKVYSIIKLKTENYDLQYYFIDVVCLVLGQLPFIPTQKELHREIDKIIDLFKTITTPPKETLQGLWAELFVIERSKNPEVLVQAWHSTPEDKFDFNNGKDKIEVKSTSKGLRVHSFSADQLSPNVNSQLIIISVFAIQAGIGKSINNLRNAILMRISDINLQLKLNDILLRTIGSDIDKISDVYFDYQLAVDSMEFYNSKDIPGIEKETIPDKVSNVHFDSDLTLVVPLSESENVIEYSYLFNALQK
ncbi:MAG: PD-(D/E)XK motif protein [Rikenellaceae bacterium]|nr:PD-(D/E)XK motif protein [Rikenellaceae bacterium]